MEVLLPKLSATMESAEVVRWLKRVGEPVAIGEPLVELATDKATIEVEAIEAGVLTSIRIDEGGTAEVGAVIATISDPRADTDPARQETGRPESLAAPAGHPVPVASVAAPGPIAASISTTSVAATPSARSLARTSGIDLAQVPGTGERGMIARTDVEAAIAARDQSGQQAAKEVLSPARRRIAEAVMHSHREIPSFWLERWIDAECAQSTMRDDSGITLTDILLAVLGKVLPGYPKLLQRWILGETPSIARFTTADVGLIVGYEDRLLVPVLRGLEAKPLGEISTQRRRAVEAARQGRVPSNMTGTCSISLSNLARGGADRFEAIIQPGQAAILAIGRVHERVVTRSGRIVLSTGFNAVLSVDHRLIDGLAGAAFLEAFAEAFEAFAADRT